jgi:glycosyltransferase involved in cell wall biosynthesis
MQILYIINGLRYGGMERQLVEIIKSLKTSGHAVYLVTLNQSGPFSEVVSPYLEASIFYLDRGKTRLPFTIIRLAELCRQIKPDIIHVQDSFSAFYALPVARILKIPLVNGSIRHAGVSHGIDYYLERILLKLSDIVIANSQAGLDFFRMKKGHVVYNFIDRRRFKSSQAPYSNLVMNANFSDYKDHISLLLAGKKLIHENKVDRIGLIGDGKHRKLYERLIIKWGLQNKVKFYGHIENIEEVLLEYGIGILCSTSEYKEGISNSILEYMGSGLIAIGTDVGATPEIINDGVNGFLFQAHNPDSLYDKVSFVLEHQDEMAKIKRNAYQTLDDKFNPLKNCQKLLSIYELSKKTR